MNNIILSTGFDAGYRYGEEYINSLARCCNIRTVIFSVGYSKHGRIFIDRPNMPKGMLQAGHFITAMPDDIDDTDVTIFTDADAVLQRPFTPDELSLFGSINDNEMLAGYNWPNQEETLAQEAVNIFPKTSMDNIVKRFPGISEMRCRNWGFVVGRLSAWKELFRRTVALWPDCNACFENPARVQFMSCYAAQSVGMTLTDLPASIHAQGHCGLKHGLTKDAEGVWRQDGEVVAFAHAL